MASRATPTLGRVERCLLHGEQVFGLLVEVVVGAGCHQFVVARHRFLQLFHRDARLFRQLFQRVGLEHLAVVGFQARVHEVDVVLRHERIAHVAAHGVPEHPAAARELERLDVLLAEVGVEDGPRDVVGSGA